jgi:heat shock protein HslJ
MISYRRFLPLAAVVAALTACGGDDATAPSADDLEGRTFVAVSIEGHTIVEGSEVAVSFEDGMILVEAGCNSQRGGFEVDDDGSLVAGQLAATMMACDDALMAQDQLMADILAAQPSISLDGDELVLTTDSTTVTMTERT